MATKTKLSLGSAAAALAVASLVACGITSNASKIDTAGTAPAATAAPGQSTITVTVNHPDDPQYRDPNNSGIDLGYAASSTFDTMGVCLAQPCVPSGQGYFPLVLIGTGNGRNFFKRPSQDGQGQVPDSYVAKPNQSLVIVATSSTNTSTTDSRTIQFTCAPGAANPVAACQAPAAATATAASTAAAASTATAAATSTAAAAATATASSTTTDTSGANSNNTNANTQGGDPNAGGGAGGC